MNASKHLHVSKHLLALLAVVLLQVDMAFARDVAAVCKGEASFAIRDCACTVSNRLAAGWTEETVLDAYYATPVEATQAEIQRVHALLTLGCPQDYYFMFNYHDVVRLGLAHVTPLAMVTGNTGTIYFYAQDVWE